MVKLSQKPTYLPLTPINLFTILLISINRHRKSIRCAYILHKKELTALRKKSKKKKPGGKGEEGTRKAFLEVVERTNTASDIVLLHYNATKMCCQAFWPGKNFFEKIKKGVDNRSDL